VKREHLDHLLRAASQIVGDRDLLVVGSQSVLATWDEDELPPAVVLSMEADLAPLDDPDEAKSTEIAAAIGEGSQSTHSSRPGLSTPTSCWSGSG